MTPTTALVLLINLLDSTVYPSSRGVSVYIRNSVYSKIKISVNHTLVGISRGVRSPHRLQSKSISPIFLDSVTNLSGKDFALFTNLSNIL